MVRYNYHVMRSDGCVFVLQVRLGLEAKGALATATSAMASFSDSMGYAEQGLSEHKASLAKQGHG